MLGERAKTIPFKLVRYLPITILLLVAVSWLFEMNGIRKADVYPTVSRALLIDPIYHSINMFLHYNQAHFEGNMQLLIPFGVLLTWLTSNRHVFVIVVFAQLLSNIVSGIAGQLVFGASSVMLALMAASLVRSTGYAMQDASVESRQIVVGTLLSVGSLALFIIFLGSGGTGWIAHFHHFLGFMFGGAIEAIYLFSGADGPDEQSGRTVPHRVTR
jgi:membrane associated rhomboid family serine protease